MKSAEFPVVIRFSDLDSYGHVNNAVYFTYFEEARKLFLGECLGLEFNWSEMGILLARNEANYLSVLELDDEAMIEIKVGKIGTKSMELHYEIRKKQGESWVSCTNGMSIVVAFNYKSGESIAVPDEWRALFE